MKASETTRDVWKLGELGPKWVRLFGVLGVLGVIASVGLGFVGGFDRFYESWLVSFCYFLSISLGALFFILIQHLTGATWSVVVRRFAESAAANLPLFVLFFIPILIGLPSLYEWARPEAAGDALLRHKAPYLNLTFFLIRWVIFFALWTWISRFFFVNSVKQDESGDLALTRKMEVRAAPATIAFAVTTSFACIDLLMALSPKWYSTIFGVYFFSGAALAWMAFLSLTVLRLQGAGLLRRTITAEHYHDLGKLMFAFTVFWAYIGFSQYMLIWYANIPEETIWFRERITGGWAVLSWLQLFGHFLIPFFGLISRTAKKTPGSLAFWAIWMLVMHWCDHYWLVMPGKHPGSIPFHLLDLTTFVGIGGLWVALFFHRLRDTSLVPARDPRLGDSLAFENV